MPTMLDHDIKALEIKKSIAEYTKDGKEMPLRGDEGYTKAPSSELLSPAQIRHDILANMKSFVKQMNAMRTGSDTEICRDADLAFFVKHKFGLGSVTAFYDALGIDPNQHTLMNFINEGDAPEGYSWLKPEIIREAIRLGYRKGPQYPAWVASEQNVSQKQITIPSINMSDATPSQVAENETIPVGTLSFNQRTVSIKTMGVGIKASDEAIRYINLALLSVFFEDAGVMLGLGQDTMALDVLINGDQAGMAAPVIGVANTTNGITYEDLVTVWLRMGLISRLPDVMIGNETVARKILLMQEFSGWNATSTTPRTGVTVRTPLPTTQDMYLHANMPSGDKLGILASNNALLKLNATGLLIESERVAENRSLNTYATITTGFAKLYKDAFIILDGTQTIGAAPFPSYMDVSAAQNVVIN